MNLYAPMGLRGLELEDVFPKDIAKSIAEGTVTHLSDEQLTKADQMITSARAISDSANLIKIHDAVKTEIARRKKSSPLTTWLILGALGVALWWGLKKPKR
jgi:hypothetical protein